jgi:Phospholipase B
MIRMGFLIIAACLSFSLQAVADKKPQPPQAGSYRFERNGWIYVHLEGTPEQIGYQHGSLLAPEIGDLVEVLKPWLEHTTKKPWSFYREAAEKILWPKIDSEYQKEIDGIMAGAASRGVKTDRWDIVALNALEELPYYYVPWLDKKNGKPPSTHAPGNCSAFVATGDYTKDHRIVMGHNNWTNYAVGSRWNIIFDLKPQQGHRILMDGLPGVIISDDDFGVSSAGIMVTETTITGFELFDPNGSPEFFRARKALQYADSIDDYVRIMLDGNNGGYANDWLLGDNKTGEIALFELGLKEHSLRRTKNGYYAGANFPVDPKLTKLETNFDVNKKQSSPNARRVRWEQLMDENRGKIDVKIAMDMESDRYDVIEGKNDPNERTLCGCVELSPRGALEWDWGKFYPGGTVQAKVMNGSMADKMQFWAAIGHPSGPDFVALDYLKAHPENPWMRGLLRDIRSRPWTLFTSDMKATAPTSTAP